MKQYNERLQLFAAPLQTTGTEGLSAEMKTFYDGCLLDNAEPNLVHEQFGDEYPIPQGREVLIVIGEGLAPQAIADRLGAELPVYGAALTSLF